MGEGGHFTGLGFTAGGSGMTMKISSIAMVAAVILFSLILILLFFVYLYINFYRRGLLVDVSAHRRDQFLSAAGDAAATSSTRGLDPAVLRSLPISIYRPTDLKQGLECSVCLSELAAGEMVRLLPKCSHGFHLECIDEWFRSHSTCPLCRCPVSVESSSPPPAAATDDVTFASQGGDSGSSSSSRRMLMISIPIQSMQGWLPSSVSPLPSSRSQFEELKSPAEEGKSPAASKVRSLRRRLSMGKKTGSSACSSPMVCDVEQGMVRSGVANGEGCSFFPKTPKSPTLSYLQRNLASPASVEVKIVEA